MPYGNIYWYFSSARLDFALLVDRQMQQGKCRIGICRDISVFAFAIIGGGWQFGLGVIILSIHLIIAYFGNFPTGEPVMFFRSKIVRFAVRQPFCFRQL